MHIDGIRDCLALPKIADNKLSDWKGVAFPINPQNVERGVANVKLFDDRGRPAKIRAAARREVLVIGAAAYRGYNDVKPLNIHQADAIAKKKQIRPSSLDQKAASRADRWKVRRGIATESKSRGNEPGLGK